MNCLLDTHALIWFLEGNDTLSSNAREFIENKDNIKYVSIASLWEIAIKVSLGKLKLSSSFDDFLFRLSSTQIEILSISPSHTFRISQMEFLHRDPFDRMIIAQSLEENMHVIGKDSNFLLYKVALLW